MKKSILILIASILLSYPISLMGADSETPFEFKAGDTISADMMNEIFDYINNSNKMITASELIGTWSCSLNARSSSCAVDDTITWDWTIGTDSLYRYNTGTLVMIDDGDGTYSYTTPIPNIFVCSDAVNSGFGKWIVKNNVLFVVYSSGGVAGDPTNDNNVKGVNLKKVSNTKLLMEYNPTSIPVFAECEKQNLPPTTPATFTASASGKTYNWSVTVDGVSGGNWSFKTDDKIYPLNDRSVDTTDKTSLIPYQIKNLKVSNNKMSFLRFDIPSTITDSHKINLNLVVDGNSTLNGGISIQEYGQTGWGESPNNKNIGIIDHSLGATLATLTPLDNGTIVWDNGTAVSLDSGTILSVDLTDKITSYGEEYSIAIRVLETTDKVTFFSKEKQLTDGVGGFAPQMSVWPNISFK